MDYRAYLEKIKIEYPLSYKLIEKQFKMYSINNGKVRTRIRDDKFIISGEDKAPIFTIDDFEELESVLEEFLENISNAPLYCNEFKCRSKSGDDFYLTYLFNHAMKDDYRAPVSYIKKLNSFINSQTFARTNKEISLGYIQDIEFLGIIKEGSYASSTPYYLEIMIKEGDNKYVHSRANFGIENDEAHIYDIINKRDHPEEIKRILKKLNDNKALTFQPMLVTIALLFGILHNEGINQVKICGFNFAFYKLKQRFNENVGELDEIMKRVVDKYLLYFTRFVKHLPEITITKNEDENSCLYMHLNDVTISDQPLLLSLFQVGSNWNEDTDLKR